MLVGSSYDNILNLYIYPRRFTRFSKTFIGDFSHELKHMTENRMKMLFCKYHTHLSHLKGLTIDPKMLFSDRLVYFWTFLLILEMICRKPWSCVETHLSPGLSKGVLCNHSCPLVCPSISPPLNISGTVH